MPAYGLEIIQKTHESKMPENFEDQLTKDNSTSVTDSSVTSPLIW